MPLFIVILSQKCKFQDSRFQFTYIMSPSWCVLVKDLWCNGLRLQPKRRFSMVMGSSPSNSINLEEIRISTIQRSPQKWQSPTNFSTTDFDLRPVIRYASGRLHREEFHYTWWTVNLLNIFNLHSSVTNLCPKFQSKRYQRPQQVSIYQSSNWYLLLLSQFQTNKQTNNAWMIQDDSK